MYDIIDNNLYHDYDYLKEVIQITLTKEKALDAYFSKQRAFWRSV